MAKNIGLDTAYSAVDDLNPWRPGLKQAPLASAALVLAIVGILVSATILAVSDGRTLDSWESAARFTPATYLSIASTITNIALHFALDGGTKVSWWRRALRPNTQVVDLHRIWSYGNSFFAALASFRNFNLIALASILVTFAPINGPLLQRASRVTTINIPVIPTVSVQIATQLPQNYSGYVTGHSDTPALLTPHFANVVRNYFRQITIQSKSSCQSTCFCYVQKQTGCIGELVQRSCTLIAATVEYPVQVQSDSIILDPTSTIWDDVVVGPVVDGSEPEDTFIRDGKTTYGGLHWALNSRFNSDMSLSFAGGVGYEIESDGELASAYATNVTSKPDCNILFTNPMDDMLAGARELMFRAAIDAGLANDSLTEYIPATETVTHTIYSSSYLFFAIATALSTLGILSVIAIFNGFWQLGRSVSLSPVETAKAFNAPILSSNDSNATVWDLLDEVGMRPVRYGAVVVGTDDTTSRSGFLRENPIRSIPLPGNVMVYREDCPQFVPNPFTSRPSTESAIQDDGQPLLRLQFANPGVVEAPQKDGRYTGHSYSDALASCP